MGRGGHATKPEPSMLDAGVSAFGGKSHPVAWKPTPGKKQYTWQQVAQHNTAESAWVSVGKNVYDITSWLDKHPGGRAYLLLAAGRDITDLLRTYHPFTEKPYEIIEKYEIGELSNLEFPQYKDDVSGFYKETREAVGNYFKENNLHPKDPIPGLVRLAGILFVAALCYVICVVGDRGFSFPIRMLAAIVFGVCETLPLLHCMHDASHTSIGYNENWWLFIGKFTMDWYAGASLVSWHNQHIIGHHVYTNVIGADPDLPVKPSGDVRRVMEKQTWLPMYQFQHIYLLVLYGLLAIKFRIQDVTDTFLDRSNGSIRVNPHSTRDIILQIITKSLFFFWRVYLPLFVFQVPYLEFALLFLLSEFTAGYYLTFNFQVSHVSPTSDWPQMDLGFNDEWAVSQLKTTVDYGHGSKLTTFLCGALNYQSAHHLFPSVSQYHYPAIAPIIMRVAAKHNVPYYHVPSFYQAFLLHIKHLQEMGKPKQH